MNIGKPQKIITVMPLAEPVPAPRVPRAPPPAPERTPATVPQKRDPVPA